MPHGVGHRLTEDEREIIKRRYEAGESACALAKAFGVSDVAIRKTLTRAGVRMRGLRESHRTRTVRSDAFAGDDPATAYWTGWMMADGYVADHGRIELAVQLADRDVIEKFRRFLGSNHKIGVKRDPETGEEKYAKLAVRHPGLCADLLAKGVTPRKSHTARAAASLVPVPAFWRGVLEGDGCFQNPSNCPQISLVGSRGITEQFAEFCTPHLGGYPVKLGVFSHALQTWYARVHGNAAMTLLHLVYDGAGDEVTLDRKRSTARAFFALYDGREFRVLKDVPVDESNSFEVPLLDGRVRFDPEAWRAIVVSESVDRVAPAVARAMCQTRPPYLEVTRDRVLADFEALRILNGGAMFEDRTWSMRVPSERPLLSIGSIASSNIGVRAADAFQQIERWRARHRFCPSPHARWHDEHNMTLAVRGAWKSPDSGLVDDTLRGLLLVNGYTASQFRPSVAKALIQWSGAATVLDPCAGWGDRLVGFLACGHTRSYIGIDPNAGVHFGYRQAHRLFAPDKSVRTIEGRVEDTDLSAYDGSIDLVLTSPPYFDVEKYPGVEDTWTSFDDWVSRFVDPMLGRCWKALRVGGVMAINVANARVRTQTHEIVGAFVDRSATLPGCALVGAFGMFLSPRPSGRTGHAKSAPPAEPILIWRKTS